MHRFWHNAVRPLLEAADARRILEIGAADGRHTTLLAAFCAEKGGELDVIDTVETEPVAGVRAAHPDRVRVHRGLSLKILPSLGAFDAVLIDGDHNWYTVFHELKFLAEKAGDAPFPLTLLHDVEWPFARRDMYYDPETIPPAYRKPHEHKGVMPDHPSLVSGGFNADLIIATEEGGERNGVLTAVEDFLKQTASPLSLRILSGMHGLGIVCDERLLERRPDLRRLIDELTADDRLAAHVRAVEHDRVRCETNACTLFSEVQRVDRERAGLATTTQAAQARASRAEETALRTEEHARGVERELEAIRRSWTWRVGAPLRKMGSRLKAMRSPYGVFRMLKTIWVALGMPFPNLVRGIRYRLGGLWPVRHQAFSAHDGKTHLSPHADVDVAVIIPCHDYGRFLGDAVESVLAQTTKPKDVIVVDDKSTDDTAEVAARYADKGVRYFRGEWGSVAEARNAGTALTACPFLLFLDADDVLPPHYVERCMQRMQDPDVAIAYGDMEEFGKANSLLEMPEFDREALMRNNYMSSHALVRRQAFDMVGGFRELQNSHEDWDLYRRILRYPWRAAKAETFVRYRIHPQSMLHRHRKTKRWNYAHNAGLLKTPITVFTPFAGRLQVLDRYIDGLKNLDFDPKMIRLHLFDTSNNPEFSAALKRRMIGLPFERLTYTEAPLPAIWKHSPESLIRFRVSNKRQAQYYYEMAVVYAYNTLLAACDTEFAFTIEDDVVPAPDALKRLLALMEPDVSAAVAHYPCHLQGYSLVWHEDATGNIVHYPTRREGVEEVGGSGFGCSLFRTEDLRRSPIYTRVYENPPNWYDHIAFTRLRAAGGRVLCDWGIDAEHVKTERYAKAEEN
jgi:glycosyltransferase involved in cell wall biosynthesis